MKKNYKYIILIIGLFFIGATNVLADGVGFSSSAKYASVCGFENVPVNLPKFTSGLYTVVKIAVPIILIIMGMIDFIHAIMLNDENNMKKQQKKFINRLLAAIIIFLVMAIVQFVFNTIDYDSETKNGFSGCINCILNNNCGALSASEDNKLCEKRTLEECTTGTDKNNHTCEKYKSQYSSKEVCITACNNYSGSAQDCSKHAYCRYDGKNCVTKQTNSGSTTSSGSDNSNSGDTGSTSQNDGSTSTTDTTQNTGSTSTGSKVSCSSCDKIPSSSDRAKCKKNNCTNSSDSNKNTAVSNTTSNVKNTVEQTITISDTCGKRTILTCNDMLCEYSKVFNKCVPKITTTKKSTTTTSSDICSVFSTNKCNSSICKVKNGKCIKR